MDKFQCARRAGGCKANKADASILGLLFRAIAVDLKKMAPAVDCEFQFFLFGKLERFQTQAWEDKGKSFQAVQIVKVHGRGRVQLSVYRVGDLPHERFPCR